jgi:hypothetical protein
MGAAAASDGTYYGERLELDLERYAAAHSVRSAPTGLSEEGARQAVAARCVYDARHTAA